MPRRSRERQPEGAGGAGAAATPLTPAEVASLLGVSRETLDRFQIYLEQLATWQRAINLVGASTLVDPWRRHILDSAQLARLVPDHARVLVDLGSGAGLPGLILAIMGVAEVHLIESDRRKAAFLRHVAGRLDLPVTVRAIRIEDVRNLRADVVTARALAPLPRLLDWAEPFLHPGSRCVFPKGSGYRAELTEAEKRWMMRVTVAPSLSAPEGRIIVIDEVHRVSP